MNKGVKYIRPALRTIAALALLGLAYLVLAPTGRYLLRAGWEEGKILWRRRPIADALKDPSTPEPLRAKLQIVLDARAFARDSLGLATGQSFTTVSRLDHDTLVLIVSAAYRDRLKAFTWWFPIVGSVPYKGFFDFEGARVEEKSLQDRGYDAHLGAASAFSTLGWFNDPVLPTTLRSDSITLAETVIHELTHNTYYAPGGAVFNESFANFVGSRGAERFFRARGQGSSADEMAARWGDDKVLGRFWATLYDVVDSTFKAHPGDDPPAVAERIALRDSIFHDAREQLVQELGPQVRTISPKALERTRFDNGLLMSRRVYRTGLDDFDAALKRQKGDLRATIVAIIDAARGDAEHKPFEALRTLR